MFAGSSLKYENQLWTAASRPIRPDATSSRTATHDGWWRYMNASISSTPASSQAAHHSLGIRSGHRQRLLAQDVLAGSRGRDRPVRVEVVRQGDVDGVDIRVGEETFVGAVGARDTEAIGHGAGLVAVSGRDGDDLHSRCPAHPRDDLPDRDVGRRHDADPQLAHRPSQAHGVDDQGDATIRAAHAPLLRP